MRLIGRLLVVLLAISMILWSVPWLLQLQDITFSSKRLNKQTGWSRSVAYEISRDEWTTFQLTSNTGLRLINTPLTKPGIVASGDIRWHYALEYQLLGAGNQVLREWVYHYRTKMTEYLDPETGEPRQRTYIENMNLLAANSRVFELTGNEIKAVKRFRVRLQQADPAIDRLLVRSYMLIRQSEKKLNYLWSRLSARARHALADASIYGTQYLRASEKENLIRWRWRPIGPMGVQDDDFVQRIIYSLREDLDVNLDDPILPEGLLIDQDKRGVLVIPEGSWDLKLQLNPLNEAALQSPLLIRWQGRHSEAVWQETLLPQDAEDFKREGVQEGLIEFSSLQPLVVKPLLFNDGTLQLLPTQKIGLRTYLTENLTPIDFIMEHDKTLDTPLRIDLRRLWRGDDAQGNAQVTYQLLGEDDLIIDQGFITVDLLPSHYDHVKSLDQTLRVSDVKRQFFRIPEGVTRVRFFSSAPVLLTVYTRPPRLRRKVRVPEDYQKTIWDPKRHPAWFYLKAMGHEAHVLNQRTLDLSLQLRPQERNMDIVAGRFQRQDIEPIGEYYERQLMIPRRTHAPVPNRSRVGIYSPLLANQAHTLSFRGHQGLKYLSPTLIYLGDKDKPQNVRVSVDGKTMIQTRLFSARAKLRLPKIAVGEHQLLITTQAKGDWLINYIDALGASQLMRYVYPLSKKTLRFKYDRLTNDAEVLTGTLYCTQALPTEIKLDITLPQINNMISDQWTFDQRLYEIRVDDTGGIPVFDNDREILHPGQNFFLPLGEDLPINQYTIEISLETDNGCYLTLYHLNLGQPSVRKFFRQDAVSSGTGL